MSDASELVVDVIHCATCHRVLKVAVPRYRELDVGGDGPELEVSDMHVSTPGSGGVVCSCSRQDLRFNRRIVPVPS